MQSRTGPSQERVECPAPGPARRHRDTEIPRVSLGARFLKLFLAMLVSIAVAATVLASPPPLVMASQLPKGALFQVIGPAAPAIAVPLSSPSPPAESHPGALLGGFLEHLAVVRPHRSRQDTPPTLQMFVLIAPMKGQVGVHALGSF